MCRKCVCVCGGGHLLFEADCPQHAACDRKHLSLISVQMEKVEIIMGCLNMVSMCTAMYANSLCVSLRA